MFISFKKGSLFLFFLLCLMFFNEASFVGRNLPCNFIDSIDISSGSLQLNKSILFNGMEFSEDNYAEVNYILRNGTTPIIVKPYVRGCPCNKKSCIRLCCPFGSLVVNVTFNGEFTCSENESVTNITGEILLENNQTEILDLPQNFNFIERACKSHFYAVEFQISYVNI